MLKENLFQLRDAISKYYADRGKYPESIEALASEKYLRRVPTDPDHRQHRDVGRRRARGPAEGRCIRREKRRAGQGPGRDGLPETGDAARSAVSPISPCSSSSPSWAWAWLSSAKRGTRPRCASGRSELLHVGEPVPQGYRALLQSGPAQYPRALSDLPEGSAQAGHRAPLAERVSGSGHGQERVGHREIARRRRDGRLQPVGSKAVQDHKLPPAGPRFRESRQIRGLEIRFRPNRPSSTDAAGRQASSRYAHTGTHSNHARHAHSRVHPNHARVRPRRRPVKPRPVRPRRRPPRAPRARSCRADRSPFPRLHLRPSRRNRSHRFSLLRADRQRARSHRTARKDASEDGVRLRLARPQPERPASIRLVLGLVDCADGSA